MRLARRVAYLEGWLPGGRLPPWVQALAAELAADAGLDPAAVVRETEAILAQATAVGVLGSAEALAAFVASESGLVPDVILADAQQILARW